MKEMLEKVKGNFAQSGYRKRRNSFYKIEDGFYKLINFQKGACGNYFFINAGLHPVGLPRLQTNTLFVPDHPKESACDLRERVGQIVEESKREIWSWPQIGDDMVPHIIDVIADIEGWFQIWGSFHAISDSSFDEIAKLFSVPPILWEKEYFMLQFYSALQTGNREAAKKLFSKYSDATVQNLNFEDLDNYLRSML